MAQRVLRSGMVAADVDDALDAPGAMSYSEFVLKTTPPLLPSTALARERLAREAGRIFDGTALAVVAPAGYGKTTLLLQWRQRWLEQGARVAWISADTLDDPVRFAALLAHAVLALGSIDAADVAGCSGREALTGILAGIARRRVHVVLVVDDCERLPEATVTQALQYLLLNAPANLHLVFGSRAALPLRTAELLARDRFRKVSVAELSLREQESLEVLQARLGERLGLDAGMRLHAAVEGWPIGLQLAIAAIEHEADPQAAVRSLSARRGSLQDYFTDSMQAAFTGGTIDALLRLALLDRFNADLGALVCAAPVDALLEQLLRETPILIACEIVGWYRLHPLARDYLLGQCERLPASERCALHARISHWYADVGHYHEAAGHALAAGDEGLSQAHAARGLWALGAAGRLDEAREWLARLPGVLTSVDPGVRLGAATLLAFSDRNDEGLQIARDVLAAPERTLEHSLGALRVASTAAAFMDSPGTLRELLEDWPRLTDPALDPLYRVNRWNVEGFLALKSGATERLRMIAEEVDALGEQPSLLLARAVNRMLLAMGQLWEGGPAQAEALLRGPLQQVERQQGRRGMIACLFSSILAQALLELEQPEAAQLLLADRLDTIERLGFPDNILAAYLALAGAAFAQGETIHAFETLAGLEALAQQRRLPRLRLHALAQRLRWLAEQDGGAHAIAIELEAIAALAAAFEQPELRPYLSEYRLHFALAHAHVALAGDDLVGAGRHLDLAEAEARALRKIADLRTLHAMRARLERRRGEQTQATWGTASGAAAHAGISPIRAVTHNAQASGEQARHHATTALAGGIAGTHRVPGLAHSALLTPKEAEILGLLERGMSNKRIALVLGIGAETVKWHLKNLFSKLSAGSREHAVDRARLLGLVG